jgi:integrase
MVRRFASWLSVREVRNEVPPRGLIEARHRRNSPYIYTEAEIQRLMAQALDLPSPNGVRARTLATLIGLMASTGLRPGEALALELNDVDLHAQVLLIRQTKFGKSRLVPIHDSTRDALAQYAKQRDQIHPHRQTARFFVSERGTGLGSCTVRRTFAKISRAIGLRQRQEDRRGRRVGRGPRLQDLRHTFATRRLVEWYRAGGDAGRQMPKLATYLGHVSVGNTYWYIEAIPELLGLASESRLHFTQGGAQ